jgi:hypothetical protein
VGCVASENGYAIAMTDEDMSEVEVDEERVATRAAQLVGDEHDVSSEDARAQARALLEDSEMRTRDRDAAPGSFVEHRRSEDTVPPDDTPG